MQLLMPDKDIKANIIVSSNWYLWNPTMKLYQVV